jgi:hypothetical protein
MAAPRPASGDQTSLNFDFHQIRELGPYPTMIRAHASRPQGPISPNIYDVGSLNGTRTNGVLWQARLDGGRRGCPGFELVVSLDQQGSQPLRAILWFEAGVFVERAATREANELYHLQQLHELRFLGGSGGGGHSYAHDPPAVGNPSGFAGHPLIRRRQHTIRVVMTSNGFVANDPEILNNIKTRLPGNSLELRLLIDLSTVGFHWRAYFLVPAADKQDIDPTVIVPFKAMVTSNRRDKPYHQLTTPQGGVHLGIDRIDTFRRRMNCSMNIINNQPVYGPPDLLLTDTRGRRDFDRYSAVQRVGHVRENQEHEAFCEEHLGADFYSMKVLRTSQPVLSRATQFMPQHYARPASPFVYLGYVEFAEEKRVLPRPGSLFTVQWFARSATGAKYGPTGHSAFGMALDLSRQPGATNNGFFMALKLGHGSVQQSAGTDLSTAPAYRVRLTYIQNRQSAQLQLDSMSQLSGMTTNINFLALRAAALRLVTGPTASDDIRCGPAPPRNNAGQMAALANAYDATANVLAGSQMMANLSQNERALLRHIPSRITGRSQSLQVPLYSPSMRAVYATMLALLVNLHRIIFVVDDAVDRSGAVRRFYNFLDEARTKAPQPQRAEWDRKVLLHWTTTDVQTAAPPAGTDAAGLPLSHPGNLVRPLIDLEFKHMLDSAPEHDFFVDQNGAYFNAPPGSPPPHHTPWNASLSNILQAHFSTAHNPAGNARAAQFYQDHTDVVNTAAAVPGVVGKLRRFNETMQDILKGVHILFTDSKTAMTEAVKSAFPTPILVLGNTHRTVFPQAAGVLMSFPNHCASFVLGDPTDERPVQLASQGRNEASRTYNRMLWETMEYAGVQHLALP